MKRVVKGLIIYLSSLFFLVFLCPDRLRGEVVDLEFEGESLSANLNRAPLQTVLDKISKEKGFWFKGGASSFEEKVSAQFTDLSLEDALKRILARCNHSLLFNKNKALVGAIIIGQRTRGLARAEGRHVRTEEMIRFQEDDELTGFREPLVEIIEEEPENLNIITAPFPPGDAVEVTEEEIDNFKATANCPPPGG